MYRQFRNKNFYILAAADMLFFGLSLFLAYALRFSFNIPPSEMRRFLHILPYVVLTKFAVFLLRDAYRGMWRYTSITDIQRLLEATLLSSLLLVGGLTFAVRLQGYPRSVFLADFIFTFFFCGGIRGAIRTIYYPHGRSKLRYFAKNQPHRNATRLLLIGAGGAADKIIREVMGNPNSHYEIVCCLDDDTNKHNRSLLGVPIEGPIEKLTFYAQQFRAREVLICMPSASGARMRHVVEICETSGLTFRTVPSIASLIDGNLTISDLREVRFEDLLGRPANKLNNEEIGHYLTGKVVLVTGAGGSIGAELCRQIIRYEPARLLLIESSEFNLYNIEIELCTGKGFNAVCPIMGHVQDRPFMERIFAHYRPQVVLHAAACKHVPMVELNPWEGIHNNILGSHTVMDLAEKYEVERFVLISTDKAVRPTNVMGATKRAAELLLQSRPPSKTRYMAVRFGNVVGSSGSVIPLFQQQIKAGGPVTVTHPDVTRYFMTIPEACQLVLQAGAIGEGGEIFVLEMGTPVKISDMAKDLIRLSGKKPDEDIPIIYTGLRPGEKLYEELITHGEGIVPTNHEKIMVLRRNDETHKRNTLLEHLDVLLACTAAYDVDRMKVILKEMIPEYVPSLTASILCPHPEQPGISNGASSATENTPEVTG
jgi:FlaA1/EpsC-like NDP-sugar epimerase